MCVLNPPTFVLNSNGANVGVVTIDCDVGMASEDGDCGRGRGPESGSELLSSSSDDGGIDWGSTN